MIRTRCEHCGEIFEAHSFRARYCSDAHRKAASRARAKAEAEADANDAETTDAVTTDSDPAGPPVSGFKLHAATLSELQAAKRETTALGLAALYAAQQIDMVGDSPGALTPAMIAQHAQAMARALGAAAGGAAPKGLADIIGGSGGLVALKGGRS